MATPHVSERMILAKTVGGLRFGSVEAIIVDANLSASIAAAKTAADAANLKLHVSQRTFAGRVKASLDMVPNYDSTYATGSSVLKASMLALSAQINGGICLAY